MANNLIQNGRELAVVFLFLLLFGVIYNLAVDHFQKRTQHYTAEFVVGGVLITVLASGFEIGWESALKVIILFAASGIPMIAGSWIRHARDEETAKRAFQHEAKELKELTK